MKRANCPFSFGVLLKKWWIECEYHDVEPEDNPFLTKKVKKSEFFCQ